MLRTHLAGDERLPSVVDAVAGAVVVMREFSAVGVACRSALPCCTRNVAPAE